MQPVHCFDLEGKHPEEKFEEISPIESLQLIRQIPKDNSQPMILGNLTLFSFFKNNRTQYVALHGVEDLQHDDNSSEDDDKYSAQWWSAMQ